MQVREAWCYIRRLIGVQGLNRGFDFVVEGDDGGGVTGCQTIGFGLLTKNSKLF